MIKKYSTYINENRSNQITIKVKDLTIEDYAILTPPRKIKRIFCDDIIEQVKWYKKGEWEEDPESKVNEIDNDFITNDIFREFLIKNNALDKFCDSTYKQRTIRNLSDFDKYWKKQLEGRSIIDNALTWSDTPNGQKYWNEINVLWKEYFKEKFNK